MACEKCNQKNTYHYWCHVCNAERFQPNFKNWTSGNDEIDKFIQHAQLSATWDREVLEWIPYDRFYNIKYIARGGFGNVYRANWIDGFIIDWDNKNKSWKRHNSNGLFALKSLNNSKNVTLKFINEITLHHRFDNGYIIRFYGITQDPKTKNYMMVLQYAENGSLRNYLNTNKSYRDLRNKILDLRYIAYGLKTIHEKELIHRDLHIGNILKLSNGDYCITDMGLCKPADCNNALENKAYGVLPYVAPEILRRQEYTKAADIYSFGIIMYEVISGLPPYYDVGHDNCLAVRICQGLRPRFNIKVPQLLVNLIKKCLDVNPLNRPTADELSKILYKWCDEFHDYRQSELVKQTMEADEINNSLETSSIASTSLSYETHSEAIYTSRLLNFHNLPEPRNSDDYYEQNDNIISAEFSESLRVDFTKLKINDAENEEV